MCVAHAHRSLSELHMCMEEQEQCQYSTTLMRNMGPRCSALPVPVHAACLCRTHLHTQALEAALVSTQLWQLLLAWDCPYRQLQAARTSLHQPSCYFHVMLQVLVIDCAWCHTNHNHT